MSTVKISAGSPPQSPGRAIAHEAAVADHVELEPERRGRCRARLRRAGRPRRSTGRRECPPSRAARAAWTSPRRAFMPGQPDRRQRHRHRQLLAEQFGRQIERRNVAQDALAQRDRREIVDVPPQRHLGIGAAVDIFEQETRQAPARQLAVIESGSCLSHRVICCAIRWNPLSSQLRLSARCAQGSAVTSS